MHCPDDIHAGLSSSHSWTLSADLALTSDPGLQRERNEDCVYGLWLGRIGEEAGQSLGLLMLADGMGGYEAGERASHVAIQAAASSLFGDAIAPMMRGAGDASPIGPPMPINEAIDRAFHAAQERVCQEVRDAATTLTIALLMGSRVYVGHAGDCRLYLVQGGVLTRLTRDHSILARLVELGQADDRVEAGRDDPRRHALYRAVGGATPLEYDYFSRSVPADAGLLLCSDGLWGVVAENEMARVIVEAPSAAQACQELVKRAKIQGGPDNISVLILSQAGRSAAGVGHGGGHAILNQGTMPDDR